MLRSVNEGPSIKNWATFMDLGLVCIPIKVMLDP